MTDRIPSASASVIAAEPPPAAGLPPAPLAPGQVRRRRMVAAAVTAGAAAGLAYLAGHNPHNPTVPMPACPIRHVTGLDCPACGTLRLTYDLLHGHWTQAVHDNVFVLAGAPLLVGLLARQARAVWRGDRAPLPPALAYGLGATAAAWMIIRNLPGWPLR
ncbi:DUF2752 domain-containing protein [Frankia sp. R82]|uniref:DUF2752 domain-containing protein n=1 Tax=Frankia sp. R82 TaxID=2950553 RepID=UPI002044C155|nr:DUF2752 domain-containing protein [Frankia sp. R82]MCM3886921.1 DUF2752 domain-containing protein [Frankia sp. R82]